MDVVNISIARSSDGRSYIAAVVGSGRAVGIGPTQAKAVEELFRWRAATETADAPPGGAE